MFRGLEHLPSGNEGAWGVQSGQEKFLGRPHYNLVGSLEVGVGLTFFLCSLMARGQGGTALNFKRRNFDLILGGNSVLRGQ